MDEIQIALSPQQPAVSRTKYEGMAAMPETSGSPLDYSKWKRIALEEAAEEEDEVQRYERDVAKEPIVTMDDVYAKEAGRLRQVDRLHELKIKMAVEAYEKLGSSVVPCLSFFVFFFFVGGGGF